MKACKDNVIIYKRLFIEKLCLAGWNLNYDCSFYYDSGDGLWWETRMTFKNGDEEKTLHHSGTTRDTLNFFVGACKGLTYLVEL